MSISPQYNPEKALAMEIETIAKKLYIPIAGREILALRPHHVIVHEGVLSGRYRQRLNESIAKMVEEQLTAIKEQYPTFPLGLDPIPSQYPIGGIYVFCGGFFGAFNGASVTHAIIASQQAGYGNIFVSPTGVLPASALIN